MLDVKKTLSKILNWSGLKFTWDFNTLNTSDTWIPVLNGNTIQHRVLPSDAYTTPTRSGSIWQSGSISIARRGDVVSVKFSGVTLAAVSTRTDFAIIPDGFRPWTEIGMIMDGGAPWVFCRPNGTIAVNQTSAITFWGCVTYLVAK